MVHRIFGWLGGYVKVRLKGGNPERFVNLCRNHGIFLWQLYWDKKKQQLYFRITLQDFYRLRPIASKCRIRVLVVKRYGMPFLLGKMRRHFSFCLGVCLCFFFVVFLSSRIWGISLEGQSYHTRESIVKYLDSIGVYGGMAIKSLQCSKVEEELRKQYNDIGWVSVERSGSKIYIRIKEVLLVEQEEKAEKGHLIAQNSGTVISIVTRKGTAKVKAGDTVKKGDILISGAVRIYGDNEELKEKDFVHAEGIVILESVAHYKEELPVSYDKKVYTGRARKVYEWQFGSHDFFYYNPLKYLETYKKYDIIREGGQLWPSISVRFPVYYYVKTFRETEVQKAEYSRQEALEILTAQYNDYLDRKKNKSYQIQNEEIELTKQGSSYFLLGDIVFRKEQDKYRKINKKKIVYKENSADGDNGNGN